MANNYYYLVSGLPELVLESSRRSVPFREFVPELKVLVAAHESVFFDYLTAEIDNRNLVCVLERRDADFVEGGRFTLEELQQEVKVPDSLPEYMRIFLEAYSQDKSLFPKLNREDQLHSLLYAETTDHPNQFISEWFTFELNLRNVLAGLNSRGLQEHGEGAQTIAREKVVIGNNEVAEQVLKSNAPDFGLSAQLPWIEQVLSWDRSKLVDFERNVDTLRWNVLDDLTTFTYFQVETVLAFCIKLRIVERWQDLDPEIGEQKLDRLTQELQAGFQMPDDFK